MNNIIFMSSSILNVILLTVSVMTQDNGSQNAPYPFQFPKDRESNSLTIKMFTPDVEITNNYPYLALLEISHRHHQNYICSGTLITSEWVLTAAQCVDGAISINVSLGVIDKSKKEEKTRKVFVSTTFIKHKNWNPKLAHNDIALIRLPERVVMNSNIATIKVAQGRETYKGEMGRFAGWGLDVFGNYHTFRHVDMEILSNKLCSIHKDYKKFIVDQHLCTSGVGNIGVCHGDSGGPLVVDDIQVGIVSFGHRDCSAGFPSVFTRLTEFDQWLAEHIENWNGHRDTTSLRKMARLFMTADSAYTMTITVIIVIITIISLVKLNNKTKINIELDKKLNEVNIDTIQLNLMKI